MIYKAYPSGDYYIGLNRDRITKGLHIKQQAKLEGTPAGSVIVETDDVRRANIDKPIAQIQSSGTIRPQFNVDPPAAFHPTVINTSFLVNSLINFGLEITKPPVSTNFGARYCLFFLSS